MRGWIRNLLHGGGELQTQLHDSALGGGEVVGTTQRSPANTEHSLKLLSGEPEPEPEADHTLVWTPGTRRSDVLEES